MSYHTISLYDGFWSRECKYNNTMSFFLYVDDYRIKWRTRSCISSIFSEVYKWYTFFLFFLFAHFLLEHNNS